MIDFDKLKAFREEKQKEYKKNHKSFLAEHKDAVKRLDSWLDEALKFPEIEKAIENSFKEQIKLMPNINNYSATIHINLIVDLDFSKISINVDHTNIEIQDFIIFENEDYEVYASYKQYMTIFKDEDLLVDYKELFMNKCIEVCKQIEGYYSATDTEYWIYDHVINYSACITFKNII